MVHTRALPLLFVLASAVLAQTNAKHFAYRTAQADCPVHLNAILDGAAKLVPAGAPGKDQRSTPRLRIALSDPKAKISSARVTVYGFPFGVRFQPAVLYFSDDPAEVAQTVVFRSPVDSGQRIWLDIALPGFGTVTSIDLISVAYADGSDWHRDRHSQCQAVAMPMHIVADDPSR